MLTLSKEAELTEYCERIDSAYVRNAVVLTLLLVIPSIKPGYTFKSGKGSEIIGIRTNEGCSFENGNMQMELKRRVYEGIIVKCNIAVYVSLLLTVDVTFVTLSNSCTSLAKFCMDKENIKIFNKKIRHIEE